MNNEENQAAVSLNVKVSTHSTHSNSSALSVESSSGNLIDEKCNKVWFPVYICSCILLLIITLGICSVLFSVCLAVTPKISGCEGKALWLYFGLAATLTTLHYVNRFFENGLFGFGTLCKELIYRRKNGSQKKISLLAEHPSTYIERGFCNYPFWVREQGR